MTDEHWYSGPLTSADVRRVLDEMMAEEWAYCRTCGGSGFALRMCSDGILRHPLPLRPCAVCNRNGRVPPWRDNPPADPYAGDDDR